MPSIDIDSYLEDDEVVSGARIQRKNRRLTARQKQIRYVAELLEAGKAPAEAQETFTPSFQPAEHERLWLLSYLEGFYQGQVITDILWKAKGGKEANVYCCAAHPDTGLELIAAKVYRPQMFRNLRNDARYRIGRSVVDEQGKAVTSRREVLAMQKKTRFGQQLRQISWLESEFKTLQMLHQAGADVPRPLEHSDNVILMEYIGADRQPAPTLNEVTLGIGEARRLIERVIDNLAIMLACHRVHADFSAYNILYWEGQFKIIDFPQAVDPRRNPEARELFTRDVERTCQYFARYHILRDARALADDLWGRYELSNALDANAALPEE